MLMTASEAKNISNTWHNRHADPLYEIDMLIREQSAKGKFKAEYESAEFTEAYGTNTLNSKHQRVLYELTKRNYKIDFDVFEKKVIISW